jgi:sucrose phosphorylase
MNPEILDHLTFLYGKETAVSTTKRLEKKLTAFAAAHPELLPEPVEGGEGSAISEKDAILITYGDMVQQPGKTPLQAQTTFLKQSVGDLISAVHILPFFPYSSDDGFSVIDYKAVDPRLGSWDDVAALGKHFRLMFDAVINHISAESDWFHGFLAGKRPYTTYFTVPNPQDDWSQVFRPRALPLFTTFDTANGPRQVWTTFSADQIDLNYASPDLLLEVLDVLLFYVAQGAEFIRLDAIAFIWKTAGTPCIHLPQTHRIIRLMRTILNLVAPRVAIITETNVPHEENISYFGDGRNEAQLVYNFSLPPLTLHAFHSGSAKILSDWAASLTLPSDNVTFFNFLASHDGIGLTPARGILSETAVAQMAERVIANGGLVSSKSNPDGSQSPYELNINYLNALDDPNADEPAALIAQRFLASQAVMLALRGVPGIYFHSLFGSQNWREGVAETGRNRTINRQKLTAETLTRELGTEGSLRRLVFSGYRRLLKARTSHPAFHPNGGQEILQLHNSLFSVLRMGKNGRSWVLCLQNVSAHTHTLAIDLNFAPHPLHTAKNLINEDTFPVSENKCVLTMRPYDVIWLTVHRRCP